MINMIVRSMKAFVSVVQFIFLEIFRAVIFYYVVLRVQQLEKEVHPHSEL